MRLGEAEQLLRDFGSHDRQAAGDRVTHRVEQRAGMGRAAQKIGAGQDGELRRRQRLPHGARLELGARWVSS